ncbi:MAG: alpha/beta hydrolase [Desulforhopalus sp.]
MALVLQLVLYFLVGYLACVLLMYLRQDSFLFFPPSVRPHDHGKADIREYHLLRGDATLRGWLVNPHLVQDKLLIYYGGNAEDIFHNIDAYEAVQAASLFVAYRGYPPSSGRPSEKALFGDGLAVYDDMTGRYAPRTVILIGRSLGSGVACHVAARRAVSGAVLITPYDSIARVAQASYPWLPVSLLLRHRFDSLSQLGRIRCPLLIIYGGRDRVIRPERTENLISHIVGDKKVVLIDRADHNTIDLFPEYWRALLHFIDEQGSTVH